jgi:serine/threonine protein kinase
MQGMEYLHQKKIVHFDLKSANLLLGYRDKRAICKVADFGLSKQKHDTYVTNVTSQRGTLPWTAPEIIKNPKMVNEKVSLSPLTPPPPRLLHPCVPDEGNYRCLSSSILDEHCWSRMLRVLQNLVQRVRYPGTFHPAGIVSGDECFSRTVARTEELETTLILERDVLLSPS